jgi:hypothetical protein
MADPQSQQNQTDPWDSKTTPAATPAVTPTAPAQAPASVATASAVPAPAPSAKLDPWDTGAPVSTPTNPNPAPPNAIADAMKRREDADQAHKAEIAKHGMLHRAWDWINQPVFDNILPDGIKTSDIIRAAAFEKMYGEAYIPGMNDFDTKAEIHLGGANKKPGVGDAAKQQQELANQKGMIKKFIANHVNDYQHSGIRQFIAGTGKDSSDEAAGFTSPLSIATYGLNKLAKIPGAVGTLARTVGPFVGTAFAGQGLVGAGTGAYNMVQEGPTPENVQETLGGLGQASLGGASTAAELGEIGKRAQAGLHPQMKDVGGQPVPVRAEGALASNVAKVVEPEVLEGAAKKTATAVQHGVGEVTKGAVGSEAETTVSDQDRFGIRGHAEDLKAGSQPAYQ